MRARFPLTLKILCIALLNVTALAAVALLFVQYELGREFTSALFAGGRDRTLAIARQLALDLNETDTAGRDALLARYERDLGVKVLLADVEGVRLAGAKLTVPDAVLARVRMRPAPGPLGRGEEPGGPPGDGSVPPPRDAVGRGRSRVPPLPPAPPFLVTTGGAQKYWAGVRIPVRARDSEVTIPGMVLLVSETLLSNPMYLEPTPWITIAAVTLGVTALCWLPFVFGVRRSIADMTRATAGIARGDFSATPKRRRRDELGQLAASIGVMAERLQSLLTGQKRFLRDAAHELRSPLGRMAASIVLLEREAGAPVRKRATELREEVELMTGLTDDLLALGRADSAPQSPVFGATNLSEAIQRAVRVEAASAAVRLDVDHDLRVLADPELLGRALANIVRNAVTYAAMYGPIDIRARRDGAEMVAVSIADQGPGVPADDLERLFVPFYRPEESRDRRTGGSGLGLAIVRAAAEAVGGSVSCRNLTPSGFEVTLDLPTAT